MLRNLAKFTLRKSSTKVYPSQSRTKWLSTNDEMFGLTPEETELRQVAHNFFKEKIDPIAARIDYEDEFPDSYDFRTFMRECGEMGFFATLVPESLGGLGPNDGTFNYFDGMLINEELARISPGAELSFGAHMYLCIHQILKHGNTEQKNKFIPDLMNGKTIGALAMSESEAGSDVVSMKTTAVRKGDKWILNGTKMWITNGPIADIYVIYAATDPAKRQATCFVIDRREHPETFTIGKRLDKMGIRGSATGELIFQDVELTDENVLGAPGKGFHILMDGLNIERITLTSAPIGVMQACNDIAFTYAHDREQFGQKIAENQLLQGKMADMYARLNSIRAYCYTLAKAADRQNYNNKDTAALILLAGEAATKQALDCVQILGGNGYIKDYPAERFLRDAKLYEIGAGTSEVRRWLLGREINLDYKLGRAFM